MDIASPILFEDNLISLPSERQTNNHKMKSFTIEKSQDVRDFILYVAKDLDVVFHPDTDFRDYISVNGMRSFNHNQALYLNDVLTMCFCICGKKNLDIYELGTSVLYPHVMC